MGLGDIPLGEDMVKALGLRDVVVEFEITSNRPDCLSVLGLARESAVTFGKPLSLPPLKKPSPCPDGDSIENYLSVDVANREKCYRYSARVVKNVKIGPSPLWLRMKLRASGVRPINNIVDITNFVMLEYGQPMHAFDYKCLDGSKIVVRSAEEGEQFISLDSVPHTLDSTMLVIADGKKPVALAGVMGGENSEITDSTATVVFIYAAKRKIQFRPRQIPAMTSHFRFFRTAAGFILWCLAFRYNKIKPDPMIPRHMATISLGRLTCLKKRPIVP